MIQKILKLELHWQILIAILFGWGLGKTIGPDATILGLNLLSVFEFVGTLFLNALRMIVIPLIVSSIIAGVGNISSLLSQNEIDSQANAWSVNRAGQGYTIEVYRRCTCLRTADFYENYRVSTDIFNNRIIVEALDDEGNVILALPDNPTYYPNLEQIFTLMGTEISNGTAVFAAFESREPARLGQLVLRFTVWLPAPSETRTDVHTRSRKSRSWLTRRTVPG